ncbi:phage tail assembly chaperone [Pseudomonas donghuensis]|uniref:phage tail assembly chaperone n=1 Tax=Pseudomonas donghuensis TaxID=1163398 RepID=UPI000C2B1738|nr:phage tail assembly chaperone [Pseudomonas donghuensis]PJY94604.1 phage tail protein [Pseudomonas donghuensis]WKY29554.1 phage tail assembly chaperone [Pseudomonas donghuensis]
MKYATFNEDGSLQYRLIEGVHDIPVHAVKVADELWFRLVNEQDGIWRLEADGTIEKELLPAVLPDYVKVERAWRDRELQTTEWLTTRHRDEQDISRPTTLTREQYVELQAYRQSLRDWPAAGAFPELAERPSAPPWVAEQVQ